VLKTKKNIWGVTDNVDQSQQTKPVYFYLF